MGKRLIIKNADFSANGILTTPVRLVDLLNVQVGYAWAAFTGGGTQQHTCPYISSTSNNARAGVTDYVNIANYGFGNVVITAKSGYKFCCYFGNSTDGTSSGGTQDNITTWTYVNSGESVSLDISACSKAVIMVAASNGTDTLTSNDINDYVTIVES